MTDLAEKERLLAWRDIKISYDVLFQGVTFAESIRLH